MFHRIVWSAMFCHGADYISSFCVIWILNTEISTQHMGREQGKYCILHCCSGAESATFGAFRVRRVSLSQNVFYFTTAMLSACGHRKMVQLFVSAKGCGLWLWHSLYFSLTFLVYMKWHGVHLFLQNCMSPRQHPNQPATRVFVVHLKTLWTLATYRVHCEIWEDCEHAQAHLSLPCAHMQLCKKFSTPVPSQNRTYIITPLLYSQGGCNEYTQSMFWADIWKISEFFYLKTFSFQFIWRGVFSSCIFFPLRHWNKATWRNHEN